MPSQADHKSASSKIAHAAVGAIDRIRPNRDLVLLDAGATAVALLLAVILNAGLDGQIPLEPAYVRMEVAAALPVGLASVIICFSRAGLYELRGRAETSELVISVIWATAIAAFLSTYWFSQPPSATQPPSARLIILAFMCALGTIVGARAAYRRVCSAAPSGSTEKSKV